jgi:hypothetical protein
MKVGIANVESRLSWEFSLGRGGITSSESWLGYVLDVKESWFHSRRGKRYFWLPKRRDRIGEPPDFLFNGYRGIFLEFSRLDFETVYSVVIFKVPCIMIQFYENGQQECRIIYCSLTALHVSSDIFHSSGTSKLYVQFLVLLSCVVAVWYRGCIGTDQFLFILDVSRQRHTFVIPEVVYTV